MNMSMPFPFVMGQEADSQKPHKTLNIVVPPRVDKAMEVLQMLNQKQMERAAVTDSQIQVLDGLKLSDEEVSVQATACRVIEMYLAGRLPTDVWEAHKDVEIKQSLKKKNVKRRPKGNVVDGKPVRLIRCPSCVEPGNAECALCGGDGKFYALRDSDLSGK